jgi:hypothetical protein
MDGFNFYFPHNDGWFSLTYGEGSNNWDAWHILKRALLLVLFIDAYGFKIKNGFWWEAALYWTLTAWIGQYIIYDLFIKLF